ncbi:MAG: DNA repair protein RadA [Patescibacteria group bacterium]|nr:DNA repair protein RadA [Patescibacteria group bacterium]
MSKSTKLFSCNKCGAQFSKWVGRCEECGAWGSIIEEKNNNLKGAGNKPASIILGKDLSEGMAIPTRLATNINEIDRVFGGGIVPGSLTLIGGEPGIGKSTIVAQITNALSDKNKVVYMSGEESTGQLALRLSRLGCSLERLSFIVETELESILAALTNNKTDLLVIDSIQTIRTATESGEAGGTSQIRAVTTKLLEFAKKNNVAVLIIGHITKDGQVAGPKTLEHLVDTVIYLETDSSQNYRLFRSSKNRFGSTNEIGIFEMTGSGLTPIENAANLFLDKILNYGAGMAITAVAEGSRSFLIEIQALTSKTVFGYPQRRASGFDANRLQILLAVIAKRAKLNTAAYDTILNIVGGLKITDPGIDLAVCLAIISSLTDKALPAKTVVMGEVGLGGEIRPVPRLEAKLNEALNLGFTKVITAKTDKKIKGLEIVEIKNISEAIGLL